MLSFYDPRQSAHAPVDEFFNGRMTAHADTPRRVQSILDRIGETRLPADHGMAPIERVHDAGYLDFLQTAHARWLAAGREGDAMPYAWPIVRRRPLDLSRIDALFGYYASDAGTPIGPGTWEGSYRGAQTALSALDAVLAGQARTAFALCRPPGHHAGRDYLSGYSYLNNAAIAAEQARASGIERVAILDVDYHHCNGTQDIFYARPDVLVCSIHANPATDFPYFWGFADEAGEGAGEGATLNLPLPRGTDWAAYRTALDIALERISAFAPGLLIVSFGADTFVGDPISGFALRTEDYPSMGAAIAALPLPTLIVMEGGYAVAELGDNVAGFLAGLDC